MATPDVAKTLNFLRSGFGPLLRLKKRFPLFGVFTLHGLVTLLLRAAASPIATGALLAFFRPELAAKVSNRTVTFAERVAHQRAIEKVYWRHRIWPKERLDRSGQ